MSNQIYLYILYKKSFTMILLKVSPYFHTFILQQKKRGSINATTKNESSSKINPFRQRREHNNIIK